MHHKIYSWLIILGILLLAFGGFFLIPGNAQENISQNVALDASALGTAFTYQGQLNEDSTPANGLYDFEFKLYDAASGGLQVGSPVTNEDVTVSNGLFTVDIDFGNVFDGAALWLEISVRSGGSTDSYTTLIPRQAIMAPHMRFIVNTHRGVV